MANHTRELITRHSYGVLPNSSTHPHTRPTDLWALAEVGLQGMNCIVELLYCLLAENHLHHILGKS